jgi:hypothetical protein
MKKIKDLTKSLFCLTRAGQMIFEKFLQPLPAIIGKCTGIIQVFAVQFLMATGGSNRLKLFPAP